MPKGPPSKRRWNLLTDVLSPVWNKPARALNEPTLLSSIKNNVDCWRRVLPIVEEYPVVLFMNGTDTYPLSGSSRVMVDILNKCSVNFKHINLYYRPELLEDLKSITHVHEEPYLFVRGEFVGDTPSILERYSKGTLLSLLKSLGAINEKKACCDEA